MSHTASLFARRLARWGIQATIVGLAACGGGGGGGGNGESSLATDSQVEADALKQRGPACTAASGFAAQTPFVVNTLAVGSQQKVRFAGPLQDGGFAVAWLSRMPADSLPSWRLQWQRFDGSGHTVGLPSDLPYTEDAAPDDVAVLVQPSGRIIVAYAVLRGIDPANPFVQMNAVFARTFQDGTSLPGQITIATRTVNVRSFPGIFHAPVLAGFEDGSFVAGWHIVGRVKPELWVQKLTAGGTPVGDVVKIDSLGSVLGLRPVGEQLITLPGGGWIAATPWRTPVPDLQDYTLLTQVGVRHPLRTPDVFNVPGALPARSVLSQDERGLLVASAPSPSGGSASIQQFNNGGNAAGQPAPLTLTPFDAVSLSNGEAALLANVGGLISLQRIGARGDPIGQPLATPALSSGVAGALPGGGVVLLWARSDADGTRVMAQLVTPSCRG